MQKIVLPLMLLLGGAPAFAQSAGVGDGQAQVQKAPEVDAGQLASKLGLDANGAATLKQTLAKYHAQMQPVRQDLWQTMKALRQELSNGQPDAGRLTQLEDQLASDRQKMQSIETARSTELRQQLTPAQYGQLILARRAFGRDMHRHWRGHGRAADGSAPVQQ